MNKKIIIGVSTLCLVMVAGFFFYQQKNQPVTYAEMDEKANTPTYINEQNPVDDSDNIAFVNTNATEIENVTSVDTVNQNQEIVPGISEFDPVEIIEYNEDYSIVKQNGVEYKVKTSDLTYSSEYNLPVYHVEGDELYKSYPKEYYSTTTEYYPEQYIGTYSTLDEGVEYYSTDGLYFYTDPNDIGDESVATFAFTADEMKFYQHMPLRAPTHITASEIDTYINEKSAANEGRPNSGSCYYADNTSALRWNKRYGYSNMSKEETPGEIIKDAENKYGVNAAFQISVAMHESCYGFSNYALSRNNFWGWGAVDSNPDAARGFASLEQGFNSFAAYLSDTYANPADFRGNGFMIGDNPDGTVNTGEDSFSGQDCSGTPSSSYTIGNIDGTEDGIGRKWATGCSWQSGVATYYAQIDARFGKKDYNSYKIGVVNGNKQFYNKDANGNYVPSIDLNGDPENNNVAWQNQYAVVITDSVGDYWEILPTAYTKNGQMATAYDVANQCVNGRPPADYDNTNYIIRCTGVSHQDFYGNQASYMEYELVPNSKWGEYGETFNNKRQYVKKSETTTFGATQPVEVIYGTVNINTKYISSSYKPNTQIYYSDGTSTSETALQITFDYNPTMVDSSGSRNLDSDYLPSVKLVAPNEAQSYEVYWKNASWVDSNTVKVNIPLSKLSSGVEYSLQVKVSPNEGWYSSVQPSHQNWLKVWTNSSTTNVAQNDLWYIQFRNKGNQAYFYGDKTEYTVATEYLSIKDNGIKTFYYSDGSTKQTDVFQISFKYRIKDENGKYYTPAYIPTIRLLAPDGTEVPIYWKNVTKSSDGTVFYVNIPYEALEGNTQYELQISVSPNERQYANMSDYYHGYFYVWTNKASSNYVQGDPTDVKFVNQGNSTEFYAISNSYMIATEYLGMKDAGNVTYHNSDGTTSTQRAVQLSFSYRIKNTSDNYYITPQYIPDIRIYDANTGDSFPVYWENVTKQSDKTKFNVVIPIIEFDPNAQYTLQIKVNGNEPTYDAFTDYYQNYFNIWTNKQNSAIYGGMTKFQFTNAGGYATFQRIPMDFSIASEFVGMNYKPQQTYYYNNGTTAKKDVIQLTFNYRLKRSDGTYVIPQFIPNIQMVASDGSDSFSIYWKNVSKSSNGYTFTVNVPIERLNLNKNYYLEIQVHPNEFVYESLSDYYKGYFKVWTNKTSLSPINYGTQQIYFNNINSYTTIKKTN